MKKICRQLSIPLGIMTAIGAIFLFGLEQPERIRLPIIIYWLPHLIGWPAFFILLSIVAGIFVWLTLNVWGAED